MSISVYYTLRHNKKSRYVSQGLFSCHKVYDYKRINNTPIFESYQEAASYRNEKNMNQCHIRKFVSTSGGCYITDYYRPKRKFRKRRK